ncbi:MAG: hypothetical protein ACE5JL_17725, partial [Dehalococcoidia bacterium]
KETTMLRLFKVQGTKIKACEGPEQAVERQHLRFRIVARTSGVLTVLPIMLFSLPETALSSHEGARFQHALVEEILFHPGDNTVEVKLKKGNGHTGFRVDHLEVRLGFDSKLAADPRLSEEEKKGPVAFYLKVKDARIKKPIIQKVRIIFISVSQLKNTLFEP